MGRKFWELLKASVLVQATIALVITLTICYLYGTEKTVPTELVNLLSLILGFYFGSKAQQQVK